MPARRCRNLHTDKNRQQASAQHTNIINYRSRSQAMPTGMRTHSTDHMTFSMFGRHRRSAACRGWAESSSKRNTQLVAGSQLVAGFAAALTTVKQAL